MDDPASGDSGPAGAGAGVSPDQLWRAMEVVWGYFEPPNRFSNEAERCSATFRATCRDGLTLHDRLLRKLWLNFTLPNSLNAPIPVPEPWQVKDSLTGMFQRGQPLLKALVVRATVPQKALTSSAPWLLTAEQEDEWTLLQEQRCLAMFEAIGSYPNAGLLTHLEMDAGPWLTAKIALALADACPNLTELELIGRREPNAATEFGLLQLYGVVGPRLKALHLRQMNEWRPVLLHGLQLCTGLEELTVNILYSREDPFVCDLAVLRAVSKLTSLRCLELSHENTDSYGAFEPTRGLSQRASDLCRLSGLTGLTKLTLQLNYYTLGDPTLPDKWKLRAEPSTVEADAKLQMVYQEQQAALGSALRRMPHLTHLVLSGPPLCTGALATLTALTHLVASRLAWPPALGPAPDGSQQRLSLELSPKLNMLWLLRPQRLDVLSALPALPTDLTVLMGRPGDLAALMGRPKGMEVGVEFVFGLEESGILAVEGSANRRLLPAAVERVRRLVGRLAAVRSCRPRNSGALRLYAEAPPGPGLLHPPAAPAGVAVASSPGHAVWIRELGPVRRPLVALRGLELVGGDLECLAATLSEMKVLVLRNCAFDMAELSAALSRHTHLRDLVLCPGRCTLDTQVVADLLLTLCQQSTSLRRLTLLHNSEDRFPADTVWDVLPCIDVRDTVARGLEDAGMGSKVELEVEDGSVEFGLEDDFAYVPDLAEEEEQEEEARGGQ